MAQFQSKYHMPRSTTGPAHWGHVKKNSLRPEILSDLFKYDLKFLFLNTVFVLVRKKFINLLLGTEIWPKCQTKNAKIAFFLSLLKFMVEN